MMIIDRDSLMEYVSQKTGNSTNSYDVDVITTGILHSDHPQYGTDWSEFLADVDLNYYLKIVEHTYHIAVKQDATGSFGIIKTFKAVDDMDATEYARENSSELDWASWNVCVLDAKLKNIHSGEHIHRKLKLSDGSFLYATGTGHA